MKTRIISGIVAIALLFLIIYLGSPFFDIAMLLVVLMGVFEYHKAADNLREGHMPRNMNYLFAFALCAVMVLNLPEFVTEVMFAYIAIMFCQFVLSRETKTKDASLAMFGGLYVVFMLSHLYYFSDSMYIWYVFLIASGADTFAYFTGRAFGKHKLAPVLSPKKTVEGSVGGVVGAMALVYLFANKFDGDHVIPLVVMAFAGSILSQFGDLIASKIKREAGIKDYGNIMPGHGGVLDRFDSILVTAPFVYYSLKLIGLL